MLDTWTIGTDAGWTTVDGVDVQTVTPLFTTKGRLTERGTQVSDVEVGGRTSALTRRELHIPWNSPAAPADAVAECTAIHDSTDPTLLGTIVRLRGPVPASQKTARRLEVVEVLT
jgi:hypothetical protein